MNWLANSALSVEVLAGHRLRTTLSLSGIVIGVASVLIMVAVGMGAERQVIERIEAMGTNLIVVTASQTRRSGGTVRRIQSAKTLKRNDVRAILAQCPSVPKAAGSIRRSIILRHKGNTVKTTLVGLEPDGFSICKLVPEAGRIYGAAEEPGNIAVTMALAGISFVAQQYAGISRYGLVGHFKNLIPSGLPSWLLPIMIPVEILSMFTKPFALMIRLFANMLAGHMVITTLLLLIALMAQVATVAGIMMTPVSLGLALFMMFLEVLVAFIQAYIFTLLTAIFIGMYAHPAH